jgi:hypothetical protein
MKSKAKNKVRESVATYRVKAKRKYAKCRELTGEELVALAEKMIAAYDRKDRKEEKRLERELINGFYGEIRA